MDDDFDGARPDGHIFDYNGDSVIALSVAFIVLCTLVVGLRFVSSRRNFSIEDWLTLPAWIVEIGLCANAMCSVIYGGVGRHEAYISKYAPGLLTGWAKTRFVTELLYAIVSPLAKTILLLLYLRLFFTNLVHGGSYHRWLRLTTYFLIVYIWLWGVSAVLVSIFQCQPVSYQWDRTDDGGAGGHCIDQLGYHRWITIPNLIHSVVMLAVPLPVIWDLEVEVRQKIASTGLFLTGLIVCVASFVRLAILTRLDQTTDNTWVSATLQSWTLVETGLLLICACLPSLWPFLQNVAIATTTTLTTRNGNGGRRRNAPKHDHNDEKELSDYSHNTQQQQQQQQQQKKTRRSHFMCCASNDLFPLQDAGDSAARTTTVYVVESSSPTDAEEDSDIDQKQGEGKGGINVTTEFSLSVSRRVDLSSRDTTSTEGERGRGIRLLSD